jgi:hypothetical protein
MRNLEHFALSPAAGHSLATSGDHSPSGGLMEDGFSFQTTKDGVFFISWQGRRLSASRANRPSALQPGHKDSMETIRVYCAGPLFNEPERAEMLAIDLRPGYLPPVTMVARVCGQHQGRVPDAGTVVEAAVTWGAGRPLVLFKADDRAPFDGEDKPMLSCLTNLQVTDSVDSIPQAVADEIARDRRADVAAPLASGHQVADAVSASRESETPTDPGEFARALASIYEDG